jgi:hypothetical protein
MIVIKASITIIDVHFANAITKKYFYKINSSPRTATKGAGRSFWKKFDLIYAFPTIMFSHNFSKFQIYATNIAKYSTQITQIKESIFNNKEITFLNTPALTTVMPSNAETEKPQTKNGSTTQTVTFNSTLLSQQQSTVNRTSNSYYNQTRLLTNPITKIRILNTFRRDNSREGIKLHPKISQAFTTRLINRLVIREISKETQTYLAAKAQNLNYNEPEAEFQRKTEDSVPKLVSIEYFNGSQSQTVKNVARQIGNGLVPTRAQENLLAPDINRLADKVCELIERKAKIERERRG